MRLYRGPFNYDHVTRFSDIPLSQPETSYRTTPRGNRKPPKANERQWSVSWGREGDQGKDFMSDRPSDRGLTGGSADARDASLRLPSLTSPHDQHAQVVPTTFATSLPGIQSYQASTQAFDLPPLPSALSTAGGRPASSASRLAGVSSILNAPADDHPQARRRKASELEQPGPPAPSLPPLATSIQGPYPSGRILASPVGSLGDSIPHQPRRILTPRSPSGQRSASLNQLSTISATVSVQHAPFPPSPSTRAYAIEPGTSGVPPLPTPTASVRQAYGLPGPVPRSEAGRSASSSAQRDPRIPSASASPTTSYSSYSQEDRTSPDTQYAPSSMATASMGYPTADQANRSAATGDSAGEQRQRPSGIPISSSGGQNVYQMMTLETTSGTVHLPVDVQAASRVADEKRRRNAGASARFRQRRKEKEKEASTIISKLEQQVKDLGEDVDFYKRERDYLAGIVLQMPNGDRHFPRPASPMRRRSSAAFRSSTGGSVNYGPGQEGITHSPQERRNVRRRTSTLSLPPPLATPLATQNAPFQGSYGTPGYGIPLAPQTHSMMQHGPGPLPSPLSRSTLPHQVSQPIGQAPGPPQSMQAAPQTGPWNPYATDRRMPGPP